MRIHRGVITPRNFCVTILISLLCQALLLSCSYPQPTVTGSPGVTVFSGDPAERPVSTPSPYPAFSPIPFQQQASQTALPQLTPIALTPTPQLDIQAPAQYDLNAVFDYGQHSLSISESIRYVNLSSDSLDDLILIIEPNLIPGGFNLVSMNWEGGQAVDTYDLNENRMQIPIPQSLQPGEQLGIKLDYQLDIPELTENSSFDGPAAYGYSNRQTNIVDWYPYIPPYLDGNGWIVHPHWGLGEYQVYDIADFQVSLTLVEPVDGLVVAASAPAIQVGNRYTYQLEAARTFALSASPDYLVQTTTVGNVTIYSYSFPYDKYAGEEVLYSTADAVRLYSQLILPYPRSSLSIVEADFLDGMEYEGLFFLSRGFYDLYDGTPKGYLTFIAAHETAHQWWYGLVGNDQASEPWLDEAMSTYMELIFYENVYSDYPPRSGGSLVDWWWYYRVNFYDPTGWVDASIYDFNMFRPYRDSIYLNGAKFLDDLRNLIGDQAFFAFLRDYAIRNAYGIATSQAFFSILREHTSQDLDALLTSYFQGSK